jgi:outer membrane protein assembly factor BamB
MQRLRWISTAFFLFTASASAGENWPGWRGPTGDGQSDEKNLPLTWGGKSQENVLWKSPLFPSDKVRRDQNQSSPIVWGERVFVTVSYWPEGTTEKSYPQHHVLCFNAKDGSPLWDITIPPGPWKLSDLRGGYTCGTPATDGTHVYVNFGSAVVAAVDFQGQIVWRREIKPHNFDVAWAASPVLYPPRPLGEGSGVRAFPSVIVVCDQQGNASTIYAFDGKTGEIRWEKKRPTVNWAHSTPLLAKVSGKLQLITATHNGPQGLDPTNGEVLWSYRSGPQIGDTVTPTVRDGLLYIDSGRGGAGIALDVTGQGDVSKAPLKWKVPTVAQGFSSPILVGLYLYRLQGGDLVSSWKWTTGEEVIKKERLEGVNTAASPIATADGRIYCVSGGKSYVLKAGPKLDILARNDLGDASQASPAMAAGRIYVKGGRYLYCVGAK